MLLLQNYIIILNNIYIMEWSFGQNRMLSTLETLIKPERTKRYFCCIFSKKKYS